MAKHDTTPAKDTMPSKGAKPANFPAFDEQALSNLTEKIEEGLDKSKVSERSSQRSDKFKKLDDSRTTILEHRNLKESTNGRITGKKRDAKGNIKESSTTHSSKPKTRKETAKSAKADDRKVLLQEILALGGTEDDLNLVADAMSEDGEGAESILPTQPDSKLAKELLDFIARLGIDGRINKDPSLSGSDIVEDKDTDEVEEDVEEEWEDDAIQSSIPNTNIGSPNDDHKNVDREKKNVNRLMFEARSDWHAAPLPELPTPDLSESAPYREVITELKKHAMSLLEADSNQYASKNLSQTSSHRFLSTIMSSGTLSDKVSALTLVVQESPIHTTKSLETLLALAKKRSRGQAVTALGAFKDLLGQGVVLPADRRLKTFNTQPGLLGTLQADPVADWKVGTPLPGKITNAHLISWAYEDWLKDTYFDMLKVLEGWCNDEVEYARGRAITYVFELLKEKPEQESNLLRLLVNKLGDPEKKIASRTSYLLLQLQTTHPLMKPIIVRAIENDLLLRPGQSSHAKYYAINTLNQTILSAKEEDVARKLLQIYFELFVTLLKKPEVSKQVVGPVINRKGQVQGGGGQMGRKAKEKALNEEAAKQASGETTEKMISAVLTGVNRAFPFARSDDLTLEKHMDMLFRITHSSNFNTSIQALMLIEQLANSKNLAVERFYRTLYESLLDQRLITSSKHTMYLNLLFRALKSDLNIKRVKAFAKRLLHVITLHQPPFICGVLYLVRELETTFPGLGALITDPEDLNETDEEVFKDVIDDVSNPTGETSKSGDPHPDHIAAMRLKPETYDGRKRDPEHSNADKSCLWELLPFLSHFHPSVSMFASRLLSQNEMPPKPDLASHSLIAFLDKFVYRNARTAAGGLRGSSIMQPLAGGVSKGFLVSSKLVIHGHKPLNQEAFWRKKAEDVAVDEVFFHRYFNQVSKRKPSTKTKPVQKATKDINSDDDNENGEDEIWQALVESQPELEGDSEDDSNLEMLDLDDSDQLSSNESGLDVEDSFEDMASLGSDIDNDSDLSGLQDDVLEDDEAAPGLDELFENELQTAKIDETGNEKDTQRDERKSKRRKMKSLPTFASAEDYAELLANDDDEDTGR